MHRRTALASLPLALALACARGRDDDAGRRHVFSRGDEGPRAARAGLDAAHPEAALAVDADEAARRMGPFEWTGAVDWTVSREGNPPARVHVAERHHLTQSAVGEFSLDADLDPGLGAGSETGKHVVYAGGVTYARSRFAPGNAFRERPTDRGRDARRYRDESFRIAADLAALAGPALRLEPAGDVTVLGRPARRFRLVLAKDAPAPTPAAGRSFPASGPDDDTKRHLAFLDGRVPLALEGELDVDFATGVPLATHLRATFGVKDDPAARAQVELVAQVNAVGAAVAAVTAPEGARPDERKPAGPTAALEAAGLKKRGESAADRAEPGDDGD